jgi:CRISPR-associated protein Csm4
MPPRTLYHLAFPHGFHIGCGGVESVEETLDYAPSDTLFAAIFDTAVHLGEDPQWLLKELRITSAFPFAGKVRFYPKPVDLRALFSEAMLKKEGAGKRIKKIRFISEKLIEKAASGDALDDLLFPDDEDEEPKAGIALQGGAYWLLDEEVDHLPAKMRLSSDKRFALRRKTVSTAQTSPRVTVDRVNSAPNLFQSERIKFNEGCGLWFGADGQVDELPRILSALGDAGLGGERTAGYGVFTYSKDEPRSFPMHQGGRSFLLSRWHPANLDEIAMLKNSESAYKLASISGWLRTPGAAAQRRKRVWMIAEGSLIAGSPQGDAAKVEPDYNGSTNIAHHVYRAGFAVTLDWKRRDG